MSPFEREAMKALLGDLERRLQVFVDVLLRNIASASDREWYRLYPDNAAVTAAVGHAKRTATCAKQVLALRQVLQRASDG